VPHERASRFAVRVCRAETGSVPSRVLAGAGTVVPAVGRGCEPAVVWAPYFGSDVADASTWLQQAVVGERVRVRDRTCAGKGVDVKF